MRKCRTRLALSLRAGFLSHASCMTSPMHRMPSHNRVQPTLVTRLPCHV